MASRSRTQTVTLPRVTDRPPATTATPGAPLFEDQIRTYRRDQRRNFLLRRGAANIAQRVRGRPSPIEALLQQIKGALIE